MSCGIQALPVRPKLKVYMACAEAIDNQCHTLKIKQRANVVSSDKEFNFIMNPENGSLSSLLILLDLKQ